MVDFTSRVSSPQQIATQRSLGSGLIGAGLRQKPRSFLEALAPIAQSTVGAFLTNQANTGQEARTAAGNRALQALLGGAGGGPAPGGPAPSLAGGGPFGGAPAGAPGQVQLAAAGGAPGGGTALGQIAAGQGPSIASLLQFQQQFPEMSGTIAPLIASGLTPQKPTILSPGQIAVNRQGQEVARGTAKAPDFDTDLGKAMGDRALARSTFGADSPQAKAFDAVVAAERAGSGPDIKDEAGQRKEFSKLSGNFLTSAESFSKVKDAADNDSAAGDLALMFNFLKTIDPGARVTDKDFAMIAASGSLGDQLKAGAQRFLTGERLTPRQRADFVNQAGDSFLAAQNRQNQLETSFRGLAAQSGLRPKNVVIDFQGDLRDFKQEEQPQGRPSPQPSPQITGGAPLIGSAAAGEEQPSQVMDFDADGNLIQ